MWARRATSAAVIVVLVSIALASTILLPQGAGERGPWIITILSPEEGESIYDTLTLVWSLEKGNESKVVEFNIYISNATVISWELVASGITEEESIIKTNEYSWTVGGFLDRPEGDYKARVEVADAETNEPIKDTVSKVFSNTHEKPPSPLEVIITHPAESSSFLNNQDIEFNATIEGAVGDISVTWSSNVTGTLSHDLNFTTRLRPGSYLIEISVVDGLKRSASAMVNITVRDYNETLQPLISIVSKSIDRTNLTPGTGFNLTITLTNSGSATGINISVQAVLAGVQKSQTIPELRENESTTVVFNFTAPGAGDYNISLMVRYGAERISETMALHVSGPVGQGGKGGGGTGSKDKGILNMLLNNPLYLVVIVVIVIVLVVAVVIARRRGGKAHSSSDASLTPTNISGDIDWEALSADILGGTGAESGKSGPMPLEGNATLEGRKGGREGVGSKGKKAQKKGKKKSSKKGKKKRDEHIDEELKSVMDEVFK